MTASKHIQGILTISNPEKMDGRIRDTILRAAVNHGLGLVIKEIRKDGVIEINSYSTAFGSSSAALDTIDRFISIINEPGVAELRLSGTLMVTVISDSEPVTVRLTVERGVFTVEEATLTWKQNNEVF